VVGTLNKDIDPTEYWAEIQIRNTGSHAETVTLTARRYDGTPFQSAPNTIAPGQAQLIRLEDPTASIDSADGAGWLPALRSTVLIEPLPPWFDVELRRSGYMETSYGPCRCTPGSRP
jgi:hypothetical protein